jgi:hypothetical protein
VLSRPDALVTTSFTVNAPAALNVRVGFCTALVPPSPNVHAHDVGDPVDWSVKVTDCPAVGDAGLMVNAAVGFVPDGAVPSDGAVDWSELQAVSRKPTTTKNPQDPAPLRRIVTIASLRHAMPLLCLPSTARTRGSFRTRDLQGG